MQFFEYKKGQVHPRDYPSTTEIFHETECFLIYAKNQKDAEKIAKEHLDGKPLTDMIKFQWKPDVTYAVIPHVAL